MNRLKEEIAKAFQAEWDKVRPLGLKGDCDLIKAVSNNAAKAASEVAMKWIEDAFEAGYKRMGWEEGISWIGDRGLKEYPDKKKWLKENG